MRGTEGANARRQGEAVTLDSSGECVVTQELTALGALARE
jgi:hypothetical protein